MGKNRTPVIKAFSLLLILFVISLSPIYASAKNIVFVSIAPQKYFVEQIGKGLVDIHIMVEPGADPHTYEPKPQQMVAISKAQLYFAIGVEFEEANLKKILSTNPDIKLVHTGHGIHKIPMVSHDHHEEAAREEDHHEESEHEHGHHHEDEGEHHEEGDHDHHDHTGLDPHIWLSPPLVRIQALNILHALLEIDPEHKSVYEKNYQEFTAKIDELDSGLKQTFKGKQGLQFMVFHPSWGYFADAYGLRQIPIESQGKDPKPAQLKELIEHAREHDIRIIFVQPQFSTRSAEMIAREIDGQVVFADPLAEDWMGNLYEIAEKFRAALK